MCLIVDANLASVVFKSTSDKAFEALRKSIFSNKLTLVYGGLLTEEYKKAGVLQLEIIGQLSRSGKLFKVSDSAIQKELTLIKNKCKSNDDHIIAMARAVRKRAHVLCSNDKDLRFDFQNKQLIDKPRGKIYSPTRHDKSLARC